MPDRIEIVPYDPRWPDLFAAEAPLVRAALGDQVIAIEHFGSTAIPGLAAKPIIDILVAVRSLAAMDNAEAALAPLGYVFWRDNPKRDRMFFVKGMPPYGARRTHHVHITEPSGEMWRRRIFRDYLIKHPEAAQNYEALKRDLMAQFPDDREAYTAGKTRFIDAIMTLAEPAMAVRPGTAP
jgi:GrpB-like predicted nucleotidyltransferase (UPF0157 family)